MERCISFENLKKEKSSNLPTENIKSEQSIIKFIELLRESVITTTSPIKVSNPHILASNGR